jgi:hypothetical protein
MPSLADAFRLHPLEIRPAEPSDAEAIIAFDEVAQRDPSRVAFIRRSTRSNDCFVASADGDVVRLRSPELHVLREWLLRKSGYGSSGVIENLDRGDPELVYMKCLQSGAV